MRDDGIDTLKGALIFLVVFGHLIETGLQDGGVVRAAYLAIYLVHMPLFVAVSGYLTKPQIDPARFVKGLIIPLILAEAAYRLFDLLLLQSGSSLIAPYWLLWFLWSLLCWRLLLPFWMKLPVPLALAFVASLAAGAVEAIGYAFSLSRTIYFFPFFILGHQLAGRKLPAGNMWVVPVIVLALMVLGIGFLPAEVSHRWLFGSLPYAAFEVSDIAGAAIRAAIYAASLVAGFAVVMLLPRQDATLAVLGRASLAVYVGHGLVVLMLPYPSVRSISTTSLCPT